MTRTTGDLRLPGDRLLRLARRVFDEPVVASVFAPTIADLQEEVRHAGPGRRAQLVAHARGYWAFWLLVAASPVAFARSPVSGRSIAVLPGAHGGTVLALLVAVFFGGLWPFFSWFVLGAIMSGSVLAMVMRRWHDLHPGPLDARSAPRDPEINLSAIPVGGNIGGFMFVAGSVTIVMVGLPDLRLFFLAALIGGGLLASGLLAWRAAHPQALVPENSLAR